MKIDSVTSGVNLAPVPGGERPPAGRRTGKTGAGTSVDNPTATFEKSALDNRQPEQQQLNVEEAIQRLNKFVNVVRPEVNFTVDEASGMQVVRVVDTTTKEVIRQFPSEEAIQVAQALDRLQGLFIKEAV